MHNSSPVLVRSMRFAGPRCRGGGHASDPIFIPGIPGSGPVSPTIHQPLPTFMSYNYYIHPVDRI